MKNIIKYTSIFGGFLIGIVFQRQFMFKKHFLNENIEKIEFF